MSSHWTRTLAVLAIALGGVACTQSDQALPDGVGDRPNGAPCSAASQCVSSFCVAGVCQSTSSGTGRANGGSCTAVNDCASGYCVMNVCQGAPGGMGRANGASCGANGECASGVCAGGVCQASAGGMGASNGSPCSVPPDCGSGVCGGSVCQGRAGGTGAGNGAMCGRNEDCASLSCQMGTCRATPGGGRPNGSACTGNSDCTGGRCVMNVCSTGGGGTVGNGGMCSAPAQCASGFCVSGVCQATAGGMGRPNGGGCTMPGECASGICTDNRCAAMPGGGGGRPTGAMCQYPSDCASGICTDGTCRATAGMDGGTGDGGDARVDRPDVFADSDDLRPDSSVPGEICRNGFDDNMNGRVDEGCDCYIGQRQFCYPGNPAHAGVASCAWGTQMCTGSGGAQSVGAWSECTGFGRPAAMEACDGMDNTCDRQVDEGCRCTPGMTRPCYAGPPGTLNMGVCRAGSQTCTPMGTWGTCNEQYLPVIERCDRIDNDCDGMTDEGCQCHPGDRESCYGGAMGTMNVGACMSGQRQCNVNPDGTSSWSACLGATTPLSSDSCNGRDDNCNGQIDETCQCNPGMTAPCYNGPEGTAGVGVCRTGQMTCQSNGRWGACTGAVQPVAERCDGVDNDCDGVTDGDWCVCMENQTLVYHRRDFHMRGNRSMVEPGDLRPTLERRCEPMRCPPNQVSVEVQPDQFRCVPPPNPCPVDLNPYYTQAGEWRCERGCEVIITYGHLYDGLVVCAERPTITCPPGQTPHYTFESEIWECRPMCDNGQYDIHMIGSAVICIPC